MKVRAKGMGQYKGKMHERGEIFEIEDGQLPVQKIDEKGKPEFDAQGKPVISHTKSHLASWMEKVEDHKLEPRAAEPTVNSRDKRLPENKNDREAIDEQLEAEKMGVTK